MPTSYEKHRIVLIPFPPDPPAEAPKQNAAYEAIFVMNPLTIAHKHTVVHIVA